MKKIKYDMKIPNCRYPDKIGLWAPIHPEGETLEEMVEDYQRKNKVDEQLSYLTTITDFICGRPNLLEASHPEIDESFKFWKDPTHQGRMPTPTVMKAEKILSALPLDNMQTFKEVHNSVKKATFNVSQFGTLAVYDYSMRYCFKRGIEPEYVYLHAGTEKGTNNLQKLGYDIKIIKDSNGTKMAELSSYPDPIPSLGTLHAESFLCIYDDLLEKIKPNK